MDFATEWLRYEGIAVRHAGIEPGRATLLFLHGLGDSGRAFDEAFAARDLARFTLLVPDMPGHGASADYPGGFIAFDAYVVLLCGLLGQLATGPLLVVAHSMGGPIGASLCATAGSDRARGLISIEGNLTRKDLFISGKAAAAGERVDFEHWFRIEFVEETVRGKWAPKDPTCQRYYESLTQCRSEAFLENSRELVRRSEPNADHPLGEIAETYLSLPVPRLYCLGDGCPRETRAFLREHGEEHRHFPGASHSLMIDAAGEFYAEVHDRALRLLH